MKPPVSSTPTLDWLESLFEPTLTGLVDIEAQFVQIRHQDQTQASRECGDWQDLDADV